MIGNRALIAAAVLLVGLCGALGDASTPFPTPRGAYIALAPSLTDAFLQELGLNAASIANTDTATPPINGNGLTIGYGFSFCGPGGAVVVISLPAFFFFFFLFSFVLFVLVCAFCVRLHHPPVFCF